MFCLYLNLSSAEKGVWNFFTPRRARSAAESKAAKVALNEAHATLAKFAGATVSTDQASINCYEQGEGLDVLAENLPALVQSELAGAEKEEQQEREAQANVNDVDSQRLLEDARHRHAEELEQQLKAQAQHTEEIQHALQRMTQENADLRLKLSKQAGDSQNHRAPAEAREPLFASQKARPMPVSQTCHYTSLHLCRPERCRRSFEKEELGGRVWFGRRNVFLQFLLLTLR